jgi:hypothetical protein
VFRDVVGFGGTPVFVVFIGLFALEFSRGTYRTMLLRQPRRIRLLVGRYLALVSFVAVGLAVTELVTWTVARLEASTFDVAADSWTSLAAIGSGLRDYATVLVWLAGYSVLGMTVAVLLRSVPLALAVGIVWAGPAEYLIGGFWTSADKVFPGLLLEIVGRGGTATVSATCAMVTAVGYIAVAAVRVVSRSPAATSPRDRNRQLAAGARCPGRGAAGPGRYGPERQRAVRRHRGKCWHRQDTPARRGACDCSFGGMRVLAARGGELEGEFAYGIVRQLFEPQRAAVSPELRTELLSGPAALIEPLFGASQPAGSQDVAAEGSFAIVHGLCWLAVNVALR